MPRVLDFADGWTSSSAPTSGTFTYTSLIISGTSANSTTPSSNAIYSAGGIGAASTMTAGGSIYSGKVGFGGNFRSINDAGTTNWLAGLLGNAGQTGYSIYDLINSREVIRADGSTGALTLGASGSTQTHTLNGNLAVKQLTVAGMVKTDANGNLSSAAIKAPTVQKFTSGTSLTYTTPTNPSPLYIRVRMVGGGGGGGGSGTAAGTASGAGGNTLFGTTLLAANGGGAGGWNANGGSGGSASLGTGPVGLSPTGGSGTGSAFMDQVTVTRSPGGTGGTSALGGSGGGGAYGNAGVSSAANSGGGGGGGGAANVNQMSTGAGGGAGGYVDAIISSPAATYTYTVGSGGTAGGAGTSGFAGGAGGSGIIVVEEYYQ